MNHQKFKFKVKIKCAGQRLDVFLATQLPNCSRQVVIRQIKKGLVKISGRVILTPKTIVKPGQIIDVQLTKDVDKIVPESIKLDIVYQDKDIIVINKPAGMVMYPAGHHQHGTLANALKHRFKEFYLVHRLDKDTSGVVIIALKEKIKEFLSNLFAHREIKKTYIALLSGKLTPQMAYIDMPIKRDRGGRFKILAGGRSASSFWQVKKYLKNFTLVEVQPKTGRTHQIRVHFSAIGHPVIGDIIYGSREVNLSRHFLHAYKLEFTDWAGNKRCFTVPLPVDLNKFLNDIEK